MDIQGSFSVCKRLQQTLRCIVAWAGVDSVNGLGVSGNELCGFICSCAVGNPPLVSPLLQPSA